MVRRRLARLLPALFVALALVAGPPADARAQDGPPGPLHDIGHNVVDSFTGWNLALHLGGIGATAAMSPTGADYEVHRFFAQRPELGEWTFPAVAAGDLMPFVVGGGLLGYGYLGDSDREVAAGWAAAQATVLSFAWVNLLKAITGRPPPPEDDPTADARALSETWRFGVLRGGVFHGWPSGHTIVATALMTSVASFYDEWWISTLAYSWAGFTAYAVTSWDAGSMHWASDAVAGLLMGYAIGSTVGNAYQAGLEPDDERGSTGATMQLTPALGHQMTGVRWSMRF